MEAVKNNANFKLSFVREETGEEIVKVVNAKEIFHKICTANWDYAEPGMLFWDNISKYNLLSNNNEFEYAGVNPCAEEPLPAGGSCLLGSINLSEFVINPFTDDALIDYDKLNDTVSLSVRFLNEILDEGLSLHPLDIQRETVANWRQIGLGIMGAADMLIKLGIPYGSQKAIDVCNTLGKFIANKAIETSSILAGEEGVYPKYNSSVLDTTFFKENANYKTEALVRQNGLRNSQILTIAPTGTLSTMLCCSGGVEPIFANSYTRKTESLMGKDQYYKVYTPIVEEYMTANNIDSEEDLPDYFVTAGDIKPIDRIKMQEAFQKHIDASISSTINLPYETTVEEVEDIYMKAWQHNLKGITIYRAGCAREGILVSDDKYIDNDKKIENSPQKCHSINEIQGLPRGYVVDVSDDLIGYKRKLNTGCGSIHMEVYSDEITGEPQETFINIGSSGGCERNYQFISRLISTALRGGVPIESIIDQAMSIRPCTAYINRTKSKHDTSPGTSCPSAIGYALKDLHEKMHDRYFPECEECVMDCEDDIEYETFELKANNQTVITTTIAKCPECGEPLIFEGGCNTCKACGYSKCD